MIVVQLYVDMVQYDATPSCSPLSLHLGYTADPPLIKRTGLGEVRSLSSR